ncbi:MAG TPA: SBBP repeat-containing protein, partial [Bryobacteraceae bacterium]|nr:SBBP repeat-containing protein [Bryobacteraceae bacterium]
MILRNGTSWSVAFLFSLGTLSIAANRAGAYRVSEETKARALLSYGKLPLSFEENRGQSDARVRFLSHGNDYSILLTPSEVLLNLQAAGKGRQRSAIRMGFPGANSAPVMAGGERQSAASSYFIGNDPAKWVTGAPNFARVHYGQLYPGIDLVFYGSQGQLEYDFVVAPGADPRTIRLAFDGVDGMRLDGSGDLVVSTSAGEMRQHKPIVYQESGGVRHTIEGRYVLEPHDCVAFEIGGYDARKPLIIDPVLSFATYLGSSGDDLYAPSQAASQASYPAVAVDAQGNVYVTGYNGGNPFAGRAASSLAGGGTRVFVVKMNPTGSLVYAVFFGGGGFDVGGGIAVDSLGNAYVTGFTTSSNFPTTPGAPQRSFYGNSSNPNAFVTEVNASGTALVYSTYLGGSGSFWGRAIAVDQSGNAYVTGTASASGSTPFCTVCSISSTPSAGFLTKINARGTTGFAYSTYLPAGIGYGIAVDSNGDAYVTGSTGTVSAPSPAQGYVLKVNAGGAGVGYGPVLFGTAGAQTVGFGIALDAQNDAYVTGMTNDSAFPVTAGAAQGTYGGGTYDGFALKLNSSGSLPPMYATYIGGLGSSFLPERGSGIGVDGEGNAYVSGTTECIGFPSGADTVSGARNGGPAVLLEGTVNGLSSTWSNTTLAGSFDQVSALAFDSLGNFYAGAGSINATGGGVYKLASGGGAWTSASSGITSTTIDAIAADPNTPATVYAAGSGHLYQTTDGGTSWAQLGQAVGTSAVIAIAQTNPSTVYVGSSTGLMYSTNGGSSWNTPMTPPAGGAVFALAADPNNAMAAYAGTNTGVYQTTDAGAHWVAFGSLITTTSLAFNPVGTIYAATLNGVFYTATSSANWTQAGGLQVLSTPKLVAVDASNNVYVAFVGSGIATGTNGGTGTWSVRTYNGLTQNQILALAAPPGGSTAYAGIVAAPTAFLTEISPNGQSFLLSACIGGSDNNLGQSIAVTPGGAAYVSGASYATNFPATSGAVQQTNAGLSDDFVVGIDVPPAWMGSPLPGITLSGSLANFSWNTVSGASQYQLTVGTTPGGTQIFSGTTAGTSQTVSSIPCT